MIALRATSHKPPSNVAGYDPAREASECWYDAQAAQRAVDFFPKFLRHVEGKLAGQPFHLEPWQAEIIKTLFGWKRPDGTRRYRVCYIEIPRKNGKSCLAAGIALYLLLSDGEFGAQVYSAASDRDQASLVFNMAAAMIRQCPAMARRLRILDSIKRIRYVERNSYYRAIAADAGGSHGFNPHGIIFDELHTQRTRELWDVLRTGTGARQQPVTVAITTAGHDRLSICYELHEYARQVRDGVVPDASFLPVLYGAEDSDDWRDEAVWRKANPNLGVSVSLDYLRDEAARAQESPLYENTFRNLHLNQWTQQLTRYIPMHLWDRCRESGEPQRDTPCYGGLDLAKTQDLTAWVLVFPRSDGTYLVRPQFWIPEAAARERERQHGRPYSLWAKQGLITLVPGQVMDYRLVREQINADARAFELRQIAYDPWNATQLAVELREEDGLECLEFRQTIGNFNEPTRFLLDLVREGQLLHDGHAVLRWNADCLEVEQDKSGNVRPVKPLQMTPARIDGMVALIMALGLALRTPEPMAPGLSFL